MHPEHVPDRSLHRQRTVKCEMFYLKKFDTYEELHQAVEDYIRFYNTKRYLRKYESLAPHLKRSQALAA